jgi:hypothetical protein
MEKQGQDGQGFPLLSASTECKLIHLPGLLSVGRFGFARVRYSGIFSVSPGRLRSPDVKIQFIVLLANQLTVRDLDV